MSVFCNSTSLPIFFDEKVMLKIYCIRSPCLPVVEIFANCLEFEIFSQESSKNNEYFFSNILNVFNQFKLNYLLNFSFSLHSSKKSFIMLIKLENNGKFWLKSINF